MKGITISTMATRNASNLPGRTERSTCFQLYTDNPTNVIDLTERRLIMCAEKATDPQQKLVLMALIDDYRSGQVAVAWRSGKPVHLRVTKDA